MAPIPGDLISDPDSGSDTTDSNSRRLARAMLSMELMAILIAHRETGIGIGIGIRSSELA